MIKSNSFVIPEYGCITKNPVKYSYLNNGSVLVEEKSFNDLLDFAKTESGSTVFTIRKKSGEDLLYTQNYVGLIQTRNNTTLEILPKIYFENDDNFNEKRTKEIFVKMLKNIKYLPEYKHLGFSNIHFANMKLLEIFISMLLNELNNIVVSGLKSSYIDIEENCRFLKGNLKISENLKYNFVNKTKFFVNYDVYIENIPENRLIKSTLKYLFNITKDLNNQKKLEQLIPVFDEIDYSANYENDFSKCIIDRTNERYKNIIIWCKFFLNNKSFTSYKGDTIAFALLFPMEKVFERYVTYYIKKNCNFDKLDVKKRKYYLLHEKAAKPIFQMEPDIVAYKNNTIYIIDTKWKIISGKERNIKYGISQSDLYQILSYAKIYEENEKNNNANLSKIKTFLIYPKSQDYNEKKLFNYNDNNKIELSLLPFDLEKNFNDKYFNVFFT